MRTWTLAPWRFLLLALGLLLVIPCGIAAAAPVWNGADLGVILCLAMFVAAWWPGREEDD